MMRAQTSESAIPVEAKSEKMHGDVNRAGRGFGLVEELQSDFVGKCSGLLQPDGSVTWTFVLHARFDGLGGFVDLLRRTTAAEGLRGPLRRAPRPSLWERITPLAGLYADSREWSQTLLRRWIAILRTT
jgi:hypothetical protein